MALKKQHVWILVETTDAGMKHLHDVLITASNRHEQIVASHLICSPSDNGVIVRATVDYVPKGHETTDQIKRWWHFRVLRMLDGYRVFNVEEVHCREA